MTQQSRELFELDLYNMNKVLWTAFDKVSIEHFSPGLEDMINGNSLHQKTLNSHNKGLLSCSVVSIANEPHCNLSSYLSNDEHEKI